MKDEVASLCGSCGASVYQEHIDSGIARYDAGKLLCAHCAAEAEEAQTAVAAKAGDDDFKPIAFEDDDEPPAERLSKSRITVMSGGMGGGQKEQKLNRATDPNHAGATRCRTFHGKLNESALEFMNNQINQWVDGNPGIVVKFASSTIGVFEGKHAESHLILTLFY